MFSEAGPPHRGSIMKRQEIYLLREKNGKSEYKREKLYEVLLILFIFYTDLWALRDIMYNGNCLLAAFITGTLVVFVRQICQKTKKMSGIAQMSVYIVSLAGLLLFITAVIPGFLDMINRLIILWNLRFGTEFERYKAAGNLELGSVVLWGLLAVPFVSFLFSQIKKLRLGTLVFMGILGLMFGFIIGRSLMWESMLFFLFAMYGMLIFLAAPKRRIGVGCLLYGLTAGLFSLCIFLVTLGYQGTPVLAEWRKKTVDRFEEFRYGSDTLPQGDLQKAGGLLEGTGEETLLRVEMEEPQELYLKGFVGSVYDGKRWKTLPAEDYEGDYEGMLKWLKSKGFSAVTQYADYDRLIAEDKDTAPDYTKVTVDNMNAYRKYVYLPESVESWDDIGAEAKRDWQVQATRFFGEREYSFSMVNHASAAAEIEAASWLIDAKEGRKRQYLEAESVYHAFVEDHYLKLDENLQSWLKEEFFPEDMDMGFSEVITQVRRVLRQKVSYSETVSPVPEDREFAQWLLEDSKQGNAVYFASAAVLAFRAAGYPARYVEGYHYSGDDAGQLQESGEKVAELNCKNAHAWAEIYVSGIGWLPVEVVPGMYTETYTTKLVEGRPTYQVSSHPDDSGVEINYGAMGAEGTENDETDSHKEAFQLEKVGEYGIFMLYIIFFLYLLLEFQRAIRIAARKNYKGKESVYSEYYIKELKRLLVLGAVSGDYNRPMELSEEIAGKVPGIQPEEYERVITLLQRIRFGDKKLYAYENHTLECFAAKMKACLYRKRRLFGKLMLRYWYAIEAAG